MTTATTTPDIDALKARLKATWMDGNYDYFSRFMETSAVEFLDRVGVEPGETLFLPVGWVHHVRTLEFSIGLNLWWLTWRQAVRWAPGFLRGKLAAALASAIPTSIPQEMRNQ